MWHWDQGRLSYFQFDNLKILAKAALEADFKSLTNDEVTVLTGLPFLPRNYMPWRNYSRILKLSLITSEVDGVAVPTAIASLLAKSGSITCDEYLHFILQTFTEPSPALRGWSPDAEFRFPLVFALKYILTRFIVTGEASTSIDNIIAAFYESGFIGDESEEDFATFVTTGNIVPSLKGDFRQARESLKVISQISYLQFSGGCISLCLDEKDAEEIFREVDPIQGTVENDSNQEILRLANMLRGGSTLDFFDYKNTIVSEVIGSGFEEGKRVQKTHITIERNKKLRAMFFEKKPTTICDVCKVDTSKRYPWTDGVLDVHHLLPLASGTRVESKGTTLEDLVAVCPSCHRAIHRYYSIWLKDNEKNDFESRDEALLAYNEAKNRIK